MGYLFKCTKIFRYCPCLKKHKVVQITGVILNIFIIRQENDYTTAIGRYIFI